jgi:hypothetical protein
MKVKLWQEMLQEWEQQSTFWSSRTLKRQQGSIGRRYLPPLGLPSLKTFIVSPLMALDVPMDVVKHFHRQIFLVVRNRDKDCSGCIGVCTEPQPCSQQVFPYIWVW